MNTQLQLPGQAAAPDGSVDLASIFVMHRAFRRDLDLFAAAVTVTPPGQTRTWRALAARWRLLTTALHLHHTAEDDGIWPALLAQAPEAADVLDALEAEHARIDPLLAACADGIAAMARRDGDRARLVGDVAALGNALSEHLGHEETRALPLIQAHLSAEDWARIEEQIAARHGTVEALAMLGWVLAGLPREHWTRLPGLTPALLRCGALLQRRFARRERRTFRLVLDPTRRSRTDHLLTTISRALAGVHTALLRRTGGRFGKRFRGGDVVLLDVRGRRSGRTFTVPLLHLRDGDDFVVAASNGGIDHEPQWWRNLQASPDAVVEIGGRRIPVTASEVDGPARDALWRRLNAMLAGYDGYQAGVRRRIAVVRLRPVEATVAAARPAATPTVA